jgi:membrane-bound lytic murein transglycosylase B
VPTHREPKRGAWLAALSAAALTASAGWLAADATNAFGASTTTTTATVATTPAAPATTPTTSPAPATTATTTTATTTSAPATTATTTTATTATATATTATATTPTATTATATPTTATSTTSTTPAKVTRAQPEPTSVTRTPSTVTVTVTTQAPTPATATSTAVASDSDAATQAAVSDPLSTTLGTSSATLQAQSELNESVLSERPPATLVPIYKAAAASYGVPWQVLAAINAIETDYGTDESTSSAGAVGWMQFEPATFAKYAIPNGTGRSPSPDNAIDAIFAAAHLLAANGGATNLRQAIYAYNHADWYVDEVTFLAAQIVGAQTSESATVASKIKAMTTTAELLKGTPYVWGGGHGSWTTADGYDCSGFVSAVLHAAGYLSEPQTTQTLPAATDIESGAGTHVTLFDRTDGAGITDDHVIIDIDGQWWEEGGGSGDGGADDVHRITDVSASYLASFNLELHPKGL